MDQHQQTINNTGALSEELSRAAKGRNERLEKSLGELRASRKRNDLRQAKIEEEVRVIADEVDGAAIDLVGALGESKV